MRIKWDKPVEEREPEIGDTRPTRKFLWWPLTIDSETRWLESAVYTERWSHRLALYPGMPRVLHYRDWVPVRWGCK